ncbi:hypothetical protein PSHT_12131 [Puccinia striiformis]|uniref:Uncharacterized protein n=1 Tax=Puccinia striiformis TaxID=27350 RepID=A0A2S4UYS7_9BASI|nr:hypothetical protein PSHT_12131 [Puccinia striiformis]
MQFPGHGIVGSGGGETVETSEGISSSIASVGRICDINGVPCTAVEFSLVAGISPPDITMIAPHEYNRSLRITLANGQTRSCTYADCPTAFHQDGNDERYQIQEANNVHSGIMLEFCY